MVQRGGVGAHRRSYKRQVGVTDLSRLREGAPYVREVLMLVAVWVAFAYVTLRIAVTPDRVVLELFSAWLLGIVTKRLYDSCMTARDARRRYMCGEDKRECDK